MSTYLLLTSKFDESAALLDLDNPDHQTRLREDFKQAAHGGDQPWERFYVIDPKVNDGTPTLCDVNHTRGKFDEDDYADAHATIMVRLNRDEIHIVTRLGYRIDGRV